MSYKATITHILLFAYTITAYSCGRRTTHDDFGKNIAIHLDWQTTLNAPNHIKISFFRIDNDLTISQYINPEKDTLYIPYGEYHTLVYNWRSNGDIQYIRFENEKEYFNCRAYTDFKKNSTLAENVLTPPDSLFCWSSSEEVVSISKDNKNPPATRAGDAYNLAASPTPMVHFYGFSIPATGMQYVKSAEAVISGVARYKLLHNGEVTGAAHYMSVNVSPNANHIDFQLATFGFIAGSTHILTIKFILVDNKSVEVNYDLTKDIAAGHIGHIATPIAIPDAVRDESFTDPDIGEWNETSDEIAF